MNEFQEQEQRDALGDAREMLTEACTSFVRPMDHNKLVHPNGVPVSGGLLDNWRQDNKHAIQNGSDNIFHSVVTDFTEEAIKKLPPRRK